MFNPLKTPATSSISEGPYWGESHAYLGWSTRGSMTYWWA